MINSGWNLNAPVFKVGHNGAKPSSTAPFLESVQPALKFVSVGEWNRYGHPSPELLRRAEKVGAAVLRTDEIGTIGLITDGQAMWRVADGK